jgi:hypothetical protein
VRREEGTLNRKVTSKNYTEYKNCKQEGSGTQFLIKFGRHKSKKNLTLINTF